jgi:dihydrodipicolinate synthase/N-acetylneuraminate lyase
MAVPPLARDLTGRIDTDQNRRIIRHIEAGGVSLLLYGGNANLYHLPLEEYEPLLEMLAVEAGDATLVIPSAGPTYGLLMAQARMLRGQPFRTVMVLPQQGVTTSGGVATGVRRFAEAAGVEVLLYIKHDGFIDPNDVARLVDDKVVTAIKYATVRDDPTADPYLRELVEAVDPGIVISGIGEQPAIIHLRDFGLGGFTTGCGCVAPALSQQLLAAVHRRDFVEAERIRRQFEPLENLRNATSPIRVLHAAVAAAGIAATGPLQPLLENVDEAEVPGITAAARTLLAAT